MEREVISAKMASDILGVSPQSVREHIKKGVWTFGQYIPHKSGKGTYLIYRSRLMKFIGREEENENGIKHNDMGQPDRSYLNSLHG